MQNYMKTILSALQNWINKRLHETVPETNEAHMQLVKDENGATSWEERTHYKEVTTQNVVNLELTELISEDENGDGVADGFYLMSPWAVNLVPGGVYTVTYNGAEYECCGVNYATLDPSNLYLTDCVVLGDADAMVEDGTTHIEGSNPDAPFIFVCMPTTNVMASSEGIYGMFMSKENATSVTISVRGVVTTTTYKELEEGYLPEAVRDSAKQITLTIDDDGNVTSDTDFNTMWNMTDAQLQASITVVSSDGAHSVTVMRVLNHYSGMRIFQFTFNWWYDSNDGARKNMRVGVITCYEGDYGNIRDGVDNYVDYLPRSSSANTTEHVYWDGTNWQTAKTENYKSQVLGIADPVDPVFVVTVDNVLNGVGTADKTFAEIKAAHDAGRVVVCKYLDNYHRLHMCDETKFIFITNFCDGQMVFTRAFTITATEVSQTVYVVQLDNTINDAISAVLPTPSTADAGKILRVNSEGKYELVSLPNAEEATF